MLICSYVLKTYCTFVHMSKLFGVRVSFHERLKAERLRMQLSQEKFAQLAGVSNRSQANYESGDRKPQIDYIEALADAGVDTLYLMTGRKEAAAPDAASLGGSGMLASRRTSRTLFSFDRTRSRPCPCSTGCGSRNRGDGLGVGEQADQIVIRASDAGRAGGAWMLLSDNSHYQPEMIPPEKMSSVELLGRCVVKIGRIA
ncbi:helix-turn-helix domain-containing protein [Halomonas binhaiensis]|nr:helix-turn-helix domain-containing protein [Halomonas binhaiensis]